MEGFGAIIWWGFRESLYLFEYGRWRRYGVAYMFGISLLFDSRAWLDSLRRRYFHDFKYLHDHDLEASEEFETTFLYRRRRACLKKKMFSVETARVVSIRELFNSNQSKTTFNSKALCAPVTFPQDLPVDYSGFNAIIFGIAGVMFSFLHKYWEHLTTNPIIGHIDRK